MLGVFRLFEVSGVLGLLGVLGVLGLLVCTELLDPGIRDMRMVGIMRIVRSISVNRVNSGHRALGTWAHICIFCFGFAV